MTEKSGELGRVQDEYQATSAAGKLVQRLYRSLTDEDLEHMRRGGERVKATVRQTQRATIRRRQGAA